MKEKLKYIIAVLTAGTVGAWFLTYAKIGTAEFSLLGTLKAGLGFIKERKNKNLYILLQEPVWSRIHGG